MEGATLESGGHRCTAELALLLASNTSSAVVHWILFYHVLVVRCMTKCSLWPPVMFMEGATLESGAHQGSRISTSSCT